MKVRRKEEVYQSGVDEGEEERRVYQCACVSVWMTMEEGEGSVSGEEGGLWGERARVRCGLKDARCHHLVYCSVSDTLPLVSWQLRFFINLSEYMKTNTSRS